MVCCFFLLLLSFFASVSAKIRSCRLFKTARKRDEFRIITHTHTQSQRRFGALCRSGGKWINDGTSARFVPLLFFIYATVPKSPDRKKLPPTTHQTPLSRVIFLSLSFFPYAKDSPSADSSASVRRHRRCCLGHIPLLFRPNICIK